MGILRRNGRHLLAAAMMALSAAVAAMPLEARTSLADNPPVQAAERGNPWFNFQDGKPVAMDLSRVPRLASLSKAGGARPLSLVSADFDEDGVADLAVGYETPAGGLIVILRGNVDSILPNTKEAKARRAAGRFDDSPFLPDAEEIETSVAPDFLAAGDFDADGHADLAVAAKGGEALVFFLGDGTRRFPRVKPRPLGGAVTAFASGEIDRRDGLQDIAVTTDGASGPTLLLFESPEGAASSAIERTALSEPVRALLVADCDGDGFGDVAMAGKRLVVLRGNDRKLTAPDEERVKVQPRVTNERPLPFFAQAIALGDFVAERPRRLVLAVLSQDGRVAFLRANTAAEASAPNAPPWRWNAIRTETVSPGAVGLVRTRSSSLPVDDLLAIDPAGRAIHVAGGNVASVARFGGEAATVDRPLRLALDTTDEPVAILPVQLNQDALLDLVVLSNASSGAGALSTVVTAPMSTYTVTNTNASGAGSYAQAILDANANAGADYISFAIPGPGIPTINGNYPGTGIGPPAITGPVTIDGSTQPAGMVELDGSAISSGVARGLDFESGGGNSVVYNFVVNDFKGEGILFGGAGSSYVYGCYVGLAQNGSSASPNGTGVSILNGVPSVTIGGLTAAQRNVISGNSSYGIYVGNGDGTLVQDNYIGTSVTGSASLTNGTGIEVNSSGQNVSIGIAIANGRNVISGNATGIWIQSIGSGFLIQGNYVGLNAAGTAYLRNTSVGIMDANSSSANATVGGTSSGARNVISGNYIGLQNTTGSGALYEGNYIGTNPAGTGAIGNLLHGLYLNGGSPQVGGATSGARNVISGNNLYGIYVANGSAGTILGNYIGTDYTGAAKVANGGDGISVTSTEGSLVVGGTSASARNVISGNAYYGIQFNSGTPVLGIANTVEGNYIGLNAAGTGALPNGAAGVMISASAQITVGGTGTGMGNVISGNSGDGVYIVGAASMNVFIQKNTIGLNAAGSAGLGNGGSGVKIDGASESNTYGNQIAYNAGDGVTILSGAGNTVYANSIHSNGGLGIDLGGDGVTPNDAGDADTGANNLQNFPVITNVAWSGGNTTVSGTLNSTASSTFHLDFYANSAMDPSGYGEGETYRGTQLATTDASGNATFAFTISGSQTFPSVTATDAAGSTSEFSATWDTAAPSETSPPSLGQPMHVSKGSGTSVNVTYTAACHAASETIYRGASPISGALNWTTSYCNVGSSFDPGNPSPGAYHYFVIVGQNGISEGSYGKDSSGTERPEASGVGSCDLPQSLGSCP